MQFRSGPLTRVKLDRLLRWVERMPHDLKRAARAANLYPADVITWYAAGQDPQCRDPLYAELSWRVAEIRGERAAANYARLESLAEAGNMTAVAALEAKADASLWELSPDNEQAAALAKHLSECAPIPLLPETVPDAGPDDGLAEHAAEPPRPEP